MRIRICVNDPETIKKILLFRRTAISRLLVKVLSWMKSPAAKLASSTEVLPQMKWMLQRQVKVSERQCKHEVEFCLHRSYVKKIQFRIQGVPLVFESENVGIISQPKHSAT
jgi:hypothetical protein